MFAPNSKILTVNGVKIPIDPDFRIMCEYSAAVLRRRTEGLTDIVSRFYFAGLPEGIDAAEAAEAMDEFYVNGLAAAKDNSTIGSKTPVPCFDFEEDEGYFYAAFMGAYNIDLRTAKLHWLDFCALFKGLPDDCRLRQIIGIRAQSLGEIKSGAERRRISKLKSIYGLKVKVKRRFEAAADRNAAIAADLKRRAEEAEKKMREVRK